MPIWRFQWVLERICSSQVALGGESQTVYRNIHRQYTGKWIMRGDKKTSRWHAWCIKFAMRRETLPGLSCKICSNSSLQQASWLILLLGHEFEPQHEHCLAKACMRTNTEIQLPSYKKKRYSLADATSTGEANRGACLKTMQTSQKPCS